MPKTRWLVFIAFLIAALAVAFLGHWPPPHPFPATSARTTPGRSLPEAAKAWAVRPNELMFFFSVFAHRPAQPSGGQAAETAAMAPALIWFCQQGRGDAYCLALWPDRAELRKKRGQDVRVLAAASMSKDRFPCLQSPSFELAIQRKASGLRAGLNNRLLLRADDAEFSSKLVSVQTSGSAFQVSLRRMQPLGEIYFTDDFMRAQSSGLWRPTSGNWHLSSLQTAERSANPFSLFCRFARTPTYDPLFTGRTRRYVGIGIRTERRGGREEIIYCFENLPAWRAGLRLGDVITAVDGAPVSGMDEEEIARRVTGKAGTTVRISARRKRQTPALSSILPPGRGAADLKAGGAAAETEQPIECTVERQPLDLDLIEETAPLSRLPLSDSAFILTGYGFWSDYTFGASAKSLGEGELGLVFYRTDERNYHLFKWSAGGPMSLVRVANGEPRALAERPGGFVPNQYYRIEVCVQGCKITARVDGVVAAEARDDDLLWGEVGLYAARSLGVHFDDVVVASSDRLPSTPAKGLGPLFVNDEEMKGWASTEDDWAGPELTGNVPFRWNKLSFPGDTRVSIGRFFGERIFVVVGAGRRTRADGYGLDLNRSAGRGVLYRNGAILAHTGRLPKYFSSLALSAARGKVAAEVDQRAVLTYEDPSPLTGDKVGIGGDDFGVDFSSVSAGSSNVLDETFTTAPVNWQIAGGTWGVMNRWVCDPRWSWFGGRSKSLAAVWSKPSFVGDVTLDVYAAMEMPSYWKSPHEKACDLAVTLCGDGRNLSSGYTLIFGGELDTWTRLYRRERVVAETRSPLFLFAKREIGMEEGLALHRGWVHVRLCKQGNRVLFFSNGNLAFEFQDADPLPGGRVAVWTVNNGVLIARARIAYAERRPPALLVRECMAFSDARVSNTRDGETSSAVSPNGPEGAYVVTNAESGGNFALFLNDPVNLKETPVVDFDYKIPPGVKLDLYFDYEGDRHRVRLTGTDDDVVAVTVGRFPDASPDNRWRHAEFRLLDGMRDLYPYKSSFVIENVALANFSNEGYLLAGLGGNHKGDSYLLKNPAFREQRPGVPVVSVEFPFQSPGNSSRVIWRLRPPADRSIDFNRLAAEANGRRFRAGHPALTFRRIENRVELDLPRAGFALKEGDVLNAALRGDGGPIGPESTWRFRLSDDHSPPEDIRISFGKPNFLDDDFERDLGDCYPVGARGWTIPGPAGGWLRREPVSSASRVFLPMTGRPATATASPRGYCLRVQNKRMAHDYGVGFMKRPCDAGRYPILSFDYRLPPRVCVDLSFVLRDSAESSLGDRKALQWATQSFRQDLRSYGTFPTIGVLERPLQNNAWRHADVNLLKRLKAFDPQRKDYLISDVHIADDVSGYLGNYEGVSFWLDNIKLRPVLGAADLRPTWSASDLSGVSDYRCGFNPDPSFTPVGKASPADVASLRDGPTWFHLMLCDGAGNWSAAAHEFVFLDVTPPEAAYFAPIWEMVGTFDIRFLELGGLDPRSVVVKVGPREYRVDGKQMWYNQGTQRLTWRAGNDLPALLKEARPREASAAPQTPGVEVVLLAARDYAGNAAKTPQSWWWRVSATPVSAPDESLPGPRLGPVPRRPR